ncbi:MAG: hypothetical protein FH748_11325 [Balneolaceae bacterium]|nr:hypothetical protein [Balneolaceae bacterium]
MRAWVLSVYDKKAVLYTFFRADAFLYKHPHLCGYGKKGNPLELSPPLAQELLYRVFLIGDAGGNIRLRFVVKPDGDPFIEFLDEEGKAVKRLEP